MTISNESSGSAIAALVRSRSSFFKSMESSSNSSAGNPVNQTISESRYSLSAAERLAAAIPLTDSGPVASTRLDQIIHQTHSSTVTAEPQNSAHYDETSPTNELKSRSSSSSSANAPAQEQTSLGKKNSFTRRSFDVLPRPNYDIDSPTKATSMDLTPRPAILDSTSRTREFL